ncbi:hypothetical protein [Sphingomonas qomolangmaensis]|uniref:SPW repeat-containing protein n=1 Tax=Sphingomonas qomolangmaensis TaxID=2918765 RepID=A0ABY5LAK3_9SPHN|nr:hypothetical protein [Sphingomonas qomolangmaensis]UUL83452.1 hypothetical protein NMP03_04275 [Sphingomonas qomolangmaensis]
MNWNQRDRRTIITVAVIALWPIIGLAVALIAGGSTGAWTALAIALVPVLGGLAALWFLFVNRMEMEHAALGLVFGLPVLIYAFGVWPAVAVLAVSAVMRLIGAAIAARRAPPPATLPMSAR